jgi:transposase
MLLVGCDLHTRKQHIAILDTDTGEVRDQELTHADDAAERFYAGLPRPAVVGIETTGYALWFHALLQRLGHTLLVGEAAKIRAMVVRKTKTDRRDAYHLLDLLQRDPAINTSLRPAGEPRRPWDRLQRDRFPAVWVPDPPTRDLRALVTHRLRLVRIRTMVKNGLHAIALNQCLTLGGSLMSRRGLTQLQGLRLPPHTTQRRDDCLELLSWLKTRIAHLDVRVAEAAEADLNARRLMTHPGVGALTALTTVIVLGPVARFPGSKHVVSYIGLAPVVDSSADTRRLGHITKQGSAMLRWVLGQAALNAVRADADLKRRYLAVLHRRGRPKANVAIARKLLVRLYTMLRDQIEYDEFCRRGLAARVRKELAPSPA